MDILRQRCKVLAIERKLMKGKEISKLEDDFIKEYAKIDNIYTSLIIGDYDNLDKYSLDVVYP